MQKFHFVSISPASSNQILKGCSKCSNASSHGSIEQGLFLLTRKDKTILYHENFLTISCLLSVIKVNQKIMKTQKAKLPDPDIISSLYCLCNRKAHLQFLDGEIESHHGEMICMLCSQYMTEVKFNPQTFLNPVCGLPTIPHLGSF